MEITKSFNKLDGSKQTNRLKFDSPLSCPHCHMGFNFSENELVGGCIAASDFFGLSDNLEVQFYCPNCKNTFIATYFIEDYDYNRNCYPTKFINFKTILPNKIKFKSFVNDISPKFVTIYNQSYVAEQLGLSEICGMGYRKALEFLIKDYVLSKNVDKSKIDSIKKMPLSSCIDTYIDNDQLKSLAKASAWIVNDETHYVRKHEDFGVEDLKNFIDALLSYLELSHNIEKAQQLINK